MILVKVSYIFLPLAYLAIFSVVPYSTCCAFFVPGWAKLSPPLMNPCTEFARSAIYSVWWSLFSPIVGAEVIVVVAVLRWLLSKKV